MASDPDSGTPVSPSGPESTTPIHTGSRTLHRFGDRSWAYTEHYSTLAAEMSPYFVGPMPVATFLSKFLPPSKLSLPEVAPSFTRGMFTPVVTQDEEGPMYNLFVCP